MGIKKLLTSRSFIVGLTPIYLFLTIFILREHVEYFYLLNIILLALYIWHIVKSKPKTIHKFALLLVALSSIGISAASILTIEKVELLMDPDRITSCSLSPIVQCSPIIGSEQASAFGFPNPIIGLFGFSCIFAAAMTLLSADFKPKKSWWYTLFAGIVFGVGFSVWLFKAGVYDIGALCLYCLSVWLVSGVLFWLALTEMQRVGAVDLGKFGKRLVSKPLDPIILTVLVIFILLFFRWQDYWLSLL